jgi:hypothetical protein
MDRSALGVRNVLDLLYFLIVLVILLNIIFGIIIDTFSELRQQKLERNDKTVNYCFICGKTKLDFDRESEQPNGFKRHIRDDHYMWNYLRFIIFLAEQDQDDDDGLELFVRHCIDNKIFTWFPMNRAMCMEQKAEEDEEGQAARAVVDQQLALAGADHGPGGASASAVEELKGLVTDMKKGMDDKMDKLEKQMGVLSSLGACWCSFVCVWW